MKFVLVILVFLVLFFVVVFQIEVICEDGLFKIEGYYWVDFGMIFVYYCIVQCFILCNIGIVLLIFCEVYVSGLDFVVYYGCCVGLLFNEMCLFEIEFCFFFEGFVYGCFELNFFEDQILFDFYGCVQRWQQMVFSK